MNKIINNTGWKVCTQTKNKIIQDLQRNTFTGKHQNKNIIMYNNISL